MQTTALTATTARSLTSLAFTMDHTLLSATGLEDLALRLSSEHFWREWTEATEGDTGDERAYRLGYQLGDDPGGESGHFTDIDMAYASLYQDVVHADALSTG
jgi:hypothetical protein